jgi:NADH dehydrogenase
MPLRRHHPRVRSAAISNGAMSARCSRPDPAPPFRYRDRGTLATIGRHSAIADLRWIRLTGWPAWGLWGIVHIFFLIGFRNRVAVFLNWVWAWLTYGRGSRLITGEVSTLLLERLSQAEQRSQAPAREPAEARREQVR